MAAGGVKPAWRLILDGPAEGAWNMAVDRAMLDAHEAGEAPATVRLYAWDRPTITIGRFQKLETVDVGYCTAEGLGLARRPTGGRGVLHDDEITYSIVAGVRDGLPRGVAASYRMLCGALVETYRRLGVAAEMTARERGSNATGACYLHATAADLSLNAAKLSGSAQVWNRDSCLQHGSFVITRDVAREARVFGLGPHDARALASSTSTLSDALGGVPTSARIIDAVKAGVCCVLGVHLEEMGLSESEREGAKACIEEYRVLVSGAG